MSEWISVKDRLPDIDTNILIYTETGEWDIVQRITMSDGNYFYDNFVDETWQRYEVSWWLPLPKPPEG